MCELTALNEKKTEPADIAQYWKQEQIVVGKGNPAPKNYLFIATIQTDTIIYRYT